MMKTTAVNGERVVFLDYLRVIACGMVMLVHACEQFYFNGEGHFYLASHGDAVWATLIDSAVRASVPLFVMASSYLLFPLARPTGDFFRRRAVRVLVPFAVWALVYTWWHGGSWGQLAFNFPASTGGHLWFVPMLAGLYLLMPLLSPWAERATEREVRGWLWVWLFTTTFPFLRKLWGWLYGAPDFGAVPFLYGECPWNSFGTFQYASGFIGYLLLGFYFRRFVRELSWARTLAAAVPLWLAGMAVVWSFFYFRISAAGYPVDRPYAEAVNLEMSWEFCSTGVALTVLAYFLVLRKLTATGAFYRRVIRPLSEASYGAYLMHMLILVPAVGLVRPYLPTPLCIAAGALLTLVASGALSAAVRRLPLGIGKFICG